MYILRRDTAKEEKNNKEAPSAPPPRKNPVCATGAAGVECALIVYLEHGGPEWFLLETLLLHPDGGHGCCLVGWLTGWHRIQR